MFQFILIRLQAGSRAAKGGGSWIMIQGFITTLMQPSFLVPKGFVEVRAFGKTRAMRNHERRVDFTLLDALEQLGKVMLHWRLRHPEGQAAVDGRPHRNLVEQAAVDTDDRYGARNFWCY